MHPCSRSPGGWRSGTSRRSRPCWGVMSPPRVAGEEGQLPEATEPAMPRSADSPPLWSGYTRGSDLGDALRRGSGGFLVRPSPEDEQALAVDAVRSCLSGGRRAIVLVPEASPVPATTNALVKAFGRAGLRVRGRGRAEPVSDWLAIRDGAFDVVVGTRPAVFAPLSEVGLVWVSRDTRPQRRAVRRSGHRGIGGLRQLPFLARDPRRRHRPQHGRERCDVALRHPPGEREHGCIEVANRRHGLHDGKDPRRYVVGRPEDPASRQLPVESEPDVGTDARGELGRKVIGERPVERQQGPIDADRDRSGEDLRRRRRCGARRPDRWPPRELLAAEMAVGGGLR